MLLPITFSWCSDLGIVGQAADFFVSNIGPEYISHSEIQTGRAIDSRRWASDLPDIIRREMRKSVERFSEGKSHGRRLALGSLDERLVTCAFVDFTLDTKTSFATLDDIVVAVPGLGGPFLRWIEDECRRCRIQRLFLESGQENRRAHRFFHRHGFEQTSIVMMKEIIQGNKL